MTSPLFRLRNLFDQLVALPEHERAAFLAVQDDIDVATRRQLQGLLDADALAADLTARPAFAAAADARSWIGRRIGAYEITRELGQGGMGSVFLAERIDGDTVQQVAIKIVRPDMLDANTLARFRLERQVLALLQHPNIPGMLDLGELDDGSPYAVMEYVPGSPITAYAQEHGLDVRRRLELFLQVCEAVAYAHGNMIVHRDIKPGNVLVDRSGRPRLVDFGIAKPLLDRLGTINVEETHASQRFVSLSHAAPELLRGGAITAACDVYGLGALLYELLAGTPAFSLGERTPAQLEQEICETDPPAPSRRAAGNSALAISRDLDLITLRCLRKQPADRYASVAELAEDLRRYLDGRAVHARRGNWFYRSSRFVARHRAAVALTSLVLAVAAIGGTLLWRQQLATAAQQSRADEMTGLIMDSLNAIGARNSGGSDLPAREVFERVAAQAQASPNLSAQSRARVVLVVAQVLIELRQNAEARVLLDKLRGKIDDPTQREQAAFLTARTMVAATHFDEARAAITDALAAAGDDARRRAPWLLLAATIESRENKAPDAIEKLDRIDAALLTPNLRDYYGKERSDALWQLARQDEAVQAIADVVAEQRVRLGADAPAVYASLRELAILESRRGNFDQAEALSTKLLALAEANRGRESLDYLYALELQSTVEERHGNMQKSIELNRQMLAILEKQYGRRSRNVARQLISMGSLYSEVGEAVPAESHYREGLEIAQGVLKPDDGSLFSARIFFSLLLCRYDRPADAKPYVLAAQETLKTYEKFAQLEISKVIGVIDSLATYQLAPNAANRAALASSLHANLGKSKDFMIEQLVKDAAAKAKLLGVLPAP